MFAGMAILTIGLTYCSSSKKAARQAAQEAATAKVTYTSSVAPIISAACTPCHIAGKGNKKPYDNYANVKADIDDILRRVNLNPTDRGFMPFKRSYKLGADTIAIFQKFKDDGALEN